MSKKYLVSLLALVISLTVMAARAQQPVAPNDEALIQQYQEQIRTMLANAPPSGSASETKFRESLTSLRAKLRDLLIEKRGAFKSKIANLEPSISSPDIRNYVTSLRNELQDVNNQIGEIDSAFAQTGNGVIVVQSNIVPAPTPAPSPTNSEKLFDTTVAMLEKTDLSKAAAPAIAKSAISPSPCAQVLASSVPASKLDKGICKIANEIVKQRTNKIILLRQDKFELYPVLISKLLKANATESYVSFVTEAQEARTDQQVGAGSSSSGTTSLTVKGGVPYLFGLAVENGAATQSQSDTTITYRVNPGGLITLLSKKGFITGFQQSENDPALKFLRKTSLGFTFDTSRGAQPGVFTGDKQQLSAFSARVEFVNDRDPRLPKYARTWETFVATELVKLGNAASEATLALNDVGHASEKETFKDPALQAWLNQTNTAITDALTKAGAGADVDLVAAVIRERADLVPVDLVSADTKDAITHFAKAYSDYTARKNDLLNQIARGKVFTLEYTNNRGVNAPDTSNFNFIAATGTGARIDLTANGSFTFFNKLPGPSVTTPRPGRIRDFQFAGQLMAPFKVGESQIDFWFSGRYERLLADASTLAGPTLPNTKGDIAVGQIGLNIPIKGLGIKFPVSVTFANRTELIREKEVRGNIGFTMNWDTLFSKLKPF
jgi:hypothetical protein